MMFEFSFQKLEDQFDQSSKYAVLLMKATNQHLSGTGDWSASGSHLKRWGSDSGGAGLAGGNRVIRVAGRIKPTPSQSNPNHSVYAAETMQEKRGSMAWVAMRLRIAEFSERPPNWNGHGVGALSLATRIIALELCDILERERVLGLRVGLTGDCDIVVVTRVSDRTAEWQIDSDGDVSAMVADESGQSTFHDLGVYDAETFVNRLREGDGR